MASWRLGFTSAPDMFARRVDLPGMFDAKKIRELAVVFTVVNHEVGKFARFEGADLIAAIEGIGGVYGGGSD